ncbi:GNAT family N-acetyltransferase [Shewanella salipaludis]|uniref:GNAT family N-acetyltransferase n=1 Tax=Shewanella salipaludis TaxID=2723052 RepID=UPI001FCEB993|nr:GNAT family protein [Shewanella salipaludis]
MKPLSLDDAEGFYHAGNHACLWQWVTPNRCQTLASAQDWIEESLAMQRQGQHLPFVILDNPSQEIIGSTRYCATRKADRIIEIGFTFITPKFQRTHVNTQAKYLLLQHAFERLGAVRVELKTHENNQQSRRAIGRIGGHFEGVLRNYRLLPDGSSRNTAMFSITVQEWPRVKLELQAKMVPARGQAEALQPLE